MQKERTFRVGLANGRFVRVRAKFAFDNGDRGLIFRGRDGEDKAYQVALFQQGTWTYFNEERGRNHGTRTKKGTDSDN